MSPFACLQLRSRPSVASEFLARALALFVSFQLARSLPRSRYDDDDRRSFLNIFPECLLSLLFPRRSASSEYIYHQGFHPYVHFAHLAMSSAGQTGIRGRVGRALQKDRDRDRESTPFEPEFEEWRMLSEQREEMTMVLHGRLFGGRGNDHHKRVLPLQVCDQIEGVHFCWELLRVVVLHINALHGRRAESTPLLLLRLLTCLHDVRKLIDLMWCVAPVEVEELSREVGRALLMMRAEMARCRSRFLSLPLDRQGRRVRVFEDVDVHGLLSQSDVPPEMLFAVLPRVLARLVLDYDWPIRPGADEVVVGRMFKMCRPTLASVDA